MSIATSDKVKVDKSGQMALCMRVGGKITKQMEKEGSFMPTEMSMTDSGWMIRPTALVCTATWMELNMRVTGRRTNSMVKDSRLGQTVLATTGSTSRGKSTVKANSPGLMAAPITENSLKIILRVRESTIGPTDVNTTAPGKIIKWKATAYSRGQTEGDTRDRM